MKLANKLSVLMAATMLAGTSFTATAFAETKEKDFFVKPAYLEGMQYRNVGPWRGGRVTTVAGTASDERVYYMGAVGGGVWKTTNAGTSWQNISDKFFKTGSVGAVAVAPSDPNVVVVGMGESPFRGVASSHGDGVYISQDAGETWVNVGLKDTRQISAIHIHPENPDVIWVAAQGSPWAPTEDRGIYMTTDGGQTWNKTLFSDENTGAIDLTVDPNNPRMLYAAMWDTDREPWFIRSGGPGSALWKSADGGETWTKLEKGLPKEMGKIGVIASPAKAGLVWAIVEAKDKGGLYKSTDGGESWRKVNADRRLHARSWYYMHIVADTQDENTLYVMNSSLLKSIDGGRSFNVVPVPHGDVHDMWINPDNPEIMVNANDGGATVTLDGARSWSTIYNQPTAQMYRVSVDNNFAYRLYSGQQDNSTVAILSRAPDGTIGAEDFHAVAGCESGHVGFAQENPRYFYSGCYLGQIGEYDAETGLTRNVTAYPEIAFGVDPKDRKYRFNWNAPIWVSRYDSNVIYHAGNKLLKSTDRGVSWSEVSPDLTRNEADKQGPMGGPITNEVTENYNTIMYIAESMHEQGTIWAGTDDGLVHITRNEGESWEDVTPRGIGRGIINTIDVSPHDSATAYIAVTRYKENDHEPMIYKTSNYGKNWKQIAGGIPDGDFVRVVREDTERQGLLYVGTETSLYVSFDDGKAWQPLQMNLPHVPVTDMKVHGRDLVLSTQGRGFWILDDISPLRQMMADVHEQDGHLFVPELAYHINTGGARNGGPSSPNPPAGAVFYYSLDDMPEKGATIEVVDSDGNVLRTLKTDKKKGEAGGGSGSSYNIPMKAGLNRAVWDLRTDALEPIKGLWSIGGGADRKIDGYIVGPGDYTVRLKVGETTSEQKLSVAWDPRVEVSPADMTEQMGMVKKTYAMIDELQKSVMGLRTAKSTAEAQAKAYKDDEALVEASKVAVKAIDDWEGGLINVKREFFQDMLNWPDKLHSDLQFLASSLNGGQPPVTAGLKERFGDLSAVFSEAMKARDAVVAGEIAAFNKIFAESGHSVLSVPSFASDE